MEFYNAASFETHYFSLSPTLVSNDFIIILWCANSILSVDCLEVGYKRATACLILGVVAPGQPRGVGGGVFL